MRIAEFVRARASTAPALTLQDVGGEAEVYRQSGEILDSVALVPVAELISANWTSLNDQPAANRFALAAFERAPRPGVFGDLMDSVLANPEMAASLAADLVSALVVRIDASQDETSGIALEGYARLVLGGLVTRWGLLDAITRHADSRDELFTRHLVRVSSALYDHYAVIELKSAMETWHRIPGVEGDSAFALGLAELRDALDGATQELIAEHLRNAHAWLVSAEDLDDDRSDARLYRLAIDCIFALEQGSSAAVTNIVPQLEKTITMRQAWTTERGGFGLTEARRQAESDWFMFARSAAAAAGLLSEPSWLEPADAIAVLLEAYSAARSVRVPLQPPGGQGLIGFVEPVIAAHLVRERGLRHHLERWLLSQAGDVAARVSIEQLLELSKKALSRAQIRQFP